MTATLYPQSASITQAPALTLYAYRKDGRLARWRERKYHGDILQGQVSLAGYGFTIVVASPADAGRFRSAHRRSLAGCALVPVTPSELIALSIHTIVLCEYPGPVAMSRISTSHAAAYLTLRPDQRAGVEGTLIRNGYGPR